MFIHNSSYAQTWWSGSTLECLDCRLDGDEWILKWRFSQISSKRVQKPEEVLASRQVTFLRWLVAAALRRVNRENGRTRKHSWLSPAVWDQSAALARIRTCHYQITICSDRRNYTSGKSLAVIIQSSVIQQNHMFDWEPGQQARLFRPEMTAFHWQPCSPMWEWKLLRTVFLEKAFIFVTVNDILKKGLVATVQLPFFSSEFPVA